MINSRKKNIAIVFILLIAAFIVCFLYSKHSNDKYEKSAIEMKINSQMICSLSRIVLSDYSESWVSAIDGKDVKNANGDYARCENFDKAISWRYSFYKSKGMFSILDSLYDNVRIQMENMTPPSSEYKESHNYFTDMYSNITLLIELCKSPQGNYQEFNDRCYCLFNSILSKNKVTDLVFKEASDTISSKRLEKLMLRLKPNVNKRWEYNKIAGERFLTKNKKDPCVVTLPDGLQYKIIKNGYGKVPKEADLVTIHYRGMTIDGKEFDNSYKRKKPETFVANQIIKGWTEILTKMPVGSKWMVYIPYELGYGSEKREGIAPYSVLIFEIELLKLNK